VRPDPGRDGAGYMTEALEETAAGTSTSARVDRVLDMKAT
jgi:hypothetical protein